MTRTNAARSRARRYSPPRDTIAAAAPSPCCGGGRAARLAARLGAVIHPEGTFKVAWTGALALALLLVTLFMPLEVRLDDAGDLSTGPLDEIAGRQSSTNRRPRRRVTPP